MSIVQKEVVDVQWEGGEIANRLNADSNLKSLLAMVLLEECEIRIDPQPNIIRIYGRWKPEYKVEMSKEILETCDVIAGYVKRYLAELAVPEGKTV